MTFRFRTFRRILLGFIIAVSTVSIALSIQLLPHFYHRKIFWMIVFVQSACILRCLWSILRKPLLKQVQSVATEMIGLFLLLPFGLVLALIAVSVPFEREHISKVTPIVLQIFILANTVINLSYTACLLLVAIITAPAYDSDIWTRDIDSSPSPFPIPILFAFVFPCLARPSQATSSEQSHEVHEARPVCLSGCNCPTKSQSLVIPLGSPVSTQAASSEPAPTITPRASLISNRPVSLSRSLVRIPDAAERRASIAIAFEV
ncbi:hypothetical protein Hypma_007956 [Hypsizygus marmoreus]|uniref:Uncharacterized protein n=1 Tax=Hypsizygus marmoreus TaxID=39966 RepID=A0A369JR97_HYPMA|nr:hypothetical protein Hypma_007956 [Hypsizygus marmoreus]